ncbi:hypothetical protein PIB30_086181 [Stylosanthes scabra]|uniref:Uncharacterized protein n=1 Tax=Stylosanthes scabra TaxID=79078 RepID=A0ABU6ZRL6_9FABA|nr:hypothetical protein [Stylosanthes scabra]
MLVAKPKTTHQAQNVGLSEFGATVPDIGHGRPKSLMRATEPRLLLNGHGPYSKRPVTSFGESTRHQIISITISYGFTPPQPRSIYSLNNRDHNGYIKGRSALPSGTSSKPYLIACIRRTPKSLFGGILLVHNHLSHKPPTFCLGTSDYAGSPKTSRKYIP